ncbi:MAG TPA: hypothetical protein VFB66_07165 [Tepidisphaeraceae bacterium]|nr:hypothetical protein [Tepidisphaeraceae bacterium]
MPAPRGRAAVMKLDRLPAGLRDRYEREVLSKPATTNRAAREWLAAEGVRVSIAAVARHRARFLRDRERRTYLAAVEARTAELAARVGVTPEDLVAGARLRAQLAVFKQIRAAFEATHRASRITPPQELLAFAAALRTLVG